MQYRPRLFLLDAYALIYRGYYPMAQRPRLDSRGRNTSAIFGFVNTLGELLNHARPEYIAVAFDPPGGTFRHERYPDYKATREATPEPIRFGVPYIKAIIQAYGIPIVEVAGYEADDVIGTLAQQGERAGLDVLMVTPDKDYAQLVSPHISMYRPMRGGGYEEWGESEVCQQFGLESPKQMIDYLGMVGDAADNLPGLKGIGPVTAQKLLAQYGSLDNLLEHTHEQKGKILTALTEGRDNALLSRELATICTEVPITLDLEAMARREADLDKLAEIYTDLEFRTLLSRLNAMQAKARAESKSASPAEGEGLDLFASPQVSATPTSQPATGEEDMPTSHEAITFVHHLLDSPERIEAFVAKALQCPHLTFDTETTGLDALTAELVGMSFALDGDEAYYLPLPEERDQVLETLRPLVPLLEGQSLKIGQNIKYDLQILRSYGIKLGGPLFDTMVAHYLLMPDMNHGLDTLAQRYLGYEMLSFEALVAPQKASSADLRQVPLERLAFYAAEDALITYRLYEYFAPRLEERGQRALMDRLEMPLIPVLAEMEREGVRLDVEELARQSQALSLELSATEVELHEMAGEPFNVNSPRQVGEILFDKLGITPQGKKTKAGGYSTGEEVLEKLRGKHPIVEGILDYRALRKLLSTYIDALPEMLGADGRLHTTFNQTVAATGRLSSTNPNIQNIPIRTPRGQAIRAAFVPHDDECLILSADYSQIELRLMAHFSQDQALIEAFRLGHDVHQATAAKINGISLEEVTPEMRRRAKTANFGIIYGISAFGLAERLGIPRKEASSLIQGYFASYPGVDAYMKRVVLEARRDGYVSTLMGRRRYLPDINSANAIVRGYAERNAINAPLQGTAADIIKVAMIRIHEEMNCRGMRSRMILQVHDELNFNVYPEELDELQWIVRSLMEQACPELSIPLEVGIGVGKNWRDAH